MTVPIWKAKIVLIGVLLTVILAVLLTLGTAAEGAKAHSYYHPKYCGHSGISGPGWKLNLAYMYGDNNKFHAVKHLHKDSSGYYRIVHSHYYTCGAH